MPGPRLRGMTKSRGGRPSGRPLLGSEPALELLRTCGGPALFLHANCCRQRTQITSPLTQDTSQGRCQLGRMSRISCLARSLRRQDAENRLATGLILRPEFVGIHPSRDTWAASDAQLPSPTPTRKRPTFTPHVHVVAIAADPIAVARTNACQHHARSQRVPFTPHAYIEGARLHLRVDPGGSPVRSLSATVCPSTIPQYAGLPGAIPHVPGG